MRDVNNTGFKLVLGRSDWHDQFGVEGTTTDEVGKDGPTVVYDAETRTATLRSRVDRFSSEAPDPVLTSEDRTSAARDRYGSWYWLAPNDSTRIMVRNAGDDVIDTFWAPDMADRDSGPDPEEREGSVFRTADPGSSSAPELGALTITPDHRLVVAATGPNQLLVFDLHAGGPPQRIPWFGEDSYSPVDATPRRGGGLYLLDTPDDGPPRIWALDRTFRPTGGVSTDHSPDFRPLGREAPGASTPADSVSSGAALVLPSDAHATVIEALPDDTVLVLLAPEGEEPGTVVRYRPLGTGTLQSGREGSLDLTARIKPGQETQGLSPDQWASTWHGYDLAFVPGSPGPTTSVQGTLYVVGADGSQAYAFHLEADTADLTASLQPTYLPLRRFSGKGLVEAEGDVYYDMGERWLTLTPQRRPRHLEQGQIQSAPFDSEIGACTWHRVFLDADIPPETDVRIESRASDRIDRLFEQSWQEEPDLYLRDTGAEIPYYDPFPDGDRAGQGTWEALLQNAEGRYLQLRLTLEGNGRATPRITALRVYFPRFSYLEEYMPDVYQEDEASANFVERFLAITEGTLTDLEGRIAAAQTLFDVRTVPDEYLDWLASWFGASFDPALDARRKRLFLDHAVELFNQRGTLAGLVRMLSLVLDPCADDALFTPAGIADAVGRPDDADERTAWRSGVRLIEEFAAREVPRAVLGDARAPEQPTEVRIDEPWVPSDGAETLHRRFRSFLDARYGTGQGTAAREEKDANALPNHWSSEGTPVRFPPLRPAGPGEAAEQRRADWDVFVRQVVDGPYAVIDPGNVRDGQAEDKQADRVTRRFRTFLQRRYRRFDNVPGIWQENAVDFDQVTLPRRLPNNAKALADWMHFVGAVLPISRAAHQFRVLVPVDPDAEPAVQQQRLDLARRVVGKAKPAHTAFEVLPYWSAFRVGTARISLDTVLGTGSRYTPLLVGEGGLAETTVGAAHPHGVADRRLVGRDPVGASGEPSS